MTNAANEPRHPGPETAINDDSELAPSTPSRSADEEPADDEPEAGEDRPDDAHEASPNPMPAPDETPD